MRINKNQQRAPRTQTSATYARLSNGRRNERLVAGETIYGAGCAERTGEQRSIPSRIFPTFKSLLFSELLSLHCFFIVGPFFAPKCTTVIEVESKHSSLAAADPPLGFRSPFYPRIDFPFHFDQCWLKLLIQSWQRTNAERRRESKLCREKSEMKNRKANRWIRNTGRAYFLFDTLSRSMLSSRCSPFCTLSTRFAPSIELLLSFLLQFA